MKKFNEKFWALLLVFGVILSLVSSFNVSAKEVSNKKSESDFDVIEFYDGQIPYKIVRKVEGGKVSVRLYCNGNLENVFEENVNNFSLKDAVNYGSWDTKETTFASNKATVSILLSTLMLKCPNVGAKCLLIVAQGIVSGGYDYYTIKLRTRMGADNKFVYAQEEYTFYGRRSENGKKYKLYGPVTLSQKRRG